MLVGFAIVNTGARVDHDCVLGEACHIAPGATLGGSVRVGAQSLVGIGATVRQGIAIGDRVLIAGGAMVIHDVPDGERWAGVPAQGIGAVRDWRPAAIAPTDSIFGGARRNPAGVAADRAGGRRRATPARCCDRR